MSLMSECREFCTIESAESVVRRVVAPGSVVSVPLGDALGRVLAAPIVCDMDCPPFTKALMDGFAVCFDGLSRAFRIVGRVAAGGESAVRLKPGEAMGINTGAPVPAGTDTVVPVENTTMSDDGLMVNVASAAVVGQNIESQASQVAAGSIVLEAGTRLDPIGIGVAAAAGAACVSVYAQPRVGIISTGDELVDASVRPGAAQIRNSNGPMLAAMVREHGATPVELGIVRDDMNALIEAIRTGLAFDFLCLCGGVSMGTLDLVPAALEKCGVRILVRKIAIKPGKPTLFGVADSGTMVFGLAGNPISSLVCFRLLVSLALDLREGRSSASPPPWSATLIGDCKANGDRQSYLPAMVRPGARGGMTAERLSWRGSSDLFGFCGADGLIVRKPHAAGAKSGDVVEVVPLRGM